MERHPPHVVAVARGTAAAEKNIKGGGVDRETQVGRLLHRTCSK